MKNLILTTAALALTAGMAYASDTVRLGTEGPMRRGTFSMMPVKLTALSVRSATSCANAPN
jgi:hypothetical protein